MFSFIFKKDADEDVLEDTCQASGIKWSTLGSGSVLSSRFSKCPMYSSWNLALVVWTESCFVYNEKSTKINNLWTEVYLLGYDTKVVRIELCK